MLRVLFALFIVLSIAGCASFPNAVQLPEETQTVPYEQVMADPENTKGQLAQWGGVVAKVENLPEQTMLEMVYYPLRTYGRPSVGKESIGRFRVYVKGFLDPMVYQEGRSMTFSGEVIGVEEGMVGEHKYMYPTLQAKGYYLWEEIEQVDVTTISVWPYSYWGGWHRWNSWPYHQRVIIKRRNSNHYHGHQRRDNNNNSGGSNSEPSQPSRPTPPPQPSTIKKMKRELEKPKGGKVLP